MKYPLLAALASAALVWPTTTASPVSVTMDTAPTIVREHVTHGAPALAASPAPTRPRAVAAAPHKATVVAPAVASPAPSVFTLDGCEIKDPWHHRSFQVDDDCDDTADVCWDRTRADYDAVVARGYGRVGDYCVPYKRYLILPPFPNCVTADEYDDYNCDGTADYWRVRR